MDSVIQQTSRTILFEEINPEKQDLVTLVGETRNMDSLTDDKIKEIDEHLCFDSYEAVLDAMAPTVYYFFNAASQSVIYTLKRPEGIPDELVSEIPLTKQNQFMKMIETLMETKRSQSIKNVDFKFQNITKLISPDEVMNDIRLTRKELGFLYEKHENLEEGDPQRLDVGDKLNLLMEEASYNYNNIMAMLPIAIEDIKTRLLLTEGTTGHDGGPLELGTLKIGDQGELKVIAAPKEKPESEDLALLEDKTRQGLVAVLEEDYEAVNEDESSDYMRQLVVRTFAPMALGSTSSNLDIQQEVDNYNAYLAFYKQSQQDFIACVRPLAEKLIGIKIFFEQHKESVKKQSMKPKLLIANIKPEMLARSTNIPRLITYLNTVNGKNDYEHSIWFGIFPSVALERKNDVKVTRKRFQGNEEKPNNDINSLESLSRIVDECAKFRLQVFFSFESTHKNTFDYVATEGIEIFENRCRPLMDKPYSEFSVPCLPNLTIIPKDKSGVILDHKMIIEGEEGKEIVKLSKEQEDMAKLWIEGVYIGAAYLAAGIAAAWQDPEFLKARFRKNVYTQYPGVRFDIEAGDNALKAQTSLPKEITGFTSSVKDDINTRNFGFIFSSENAKVDGKQVNRITVYKARSLLMDDNLGMYEPVFKTLHTTYVQRILRYDTGDYKEDKLKFFFSNNPASQKSVWMENNSFVNSILMIGDDLNYQIDEIANICDVEITYAGVQKNLEVDISQRNASVTGSSVG